MKIIVVGAGEVGYYLCEIFSEQGHEVTLIESAFERASSAEDSLNGRVIHGNGVSATVLVKADVESCDYFMAMTSDDRTNLLSCSLAKALGAKTIIARIHDQTYSDNSYVNYQLHFGIDYLLNPEALCAVELAKIIRNPGRVAVENFASGQIEMQQVTLSRNSKYVNQTLSDIKLDSQLRIGYIHREGEYEVPTAETQLKEGDLITLIGRSERIYEERNQFDTESHRDIVSVTLFGGTETAIATVRLLSNPRFRVRIIEENLQTCQRLAERFPKITIIHGSATSLKLMEEEQIASTDYFVACTKRDEDNVMTCIQAAQLGAKHVLLVINKPDYEDVLDHLKRSLGVELAVAPRVVTVSEVMQITSDKPYIELATLPGGNVKVIELIIGYDSPICNKLVREVKWPRSCMIAALLHKFEAKVPGAEDRILGEDRIVAIVADEQIKHLRALIAPKS